MLPSASPAPRVEAAAAAYESTFFEPHLAYGTFIAGDRMPFGYISSEVGKPIFELDHFLGLPKERLTAAALIAAAGPDLRSALDMAVFMLEATTAQLRSWRIEPAINADHGIAVAKAAIAKADGATS